ncbi:hypothetical protein IMSAG049_00347 [Clostridiales bacterium]|nr:hypothetical protein IMSAG049_00347 [Clostridiales bacterium]
MSGAEGIAPTVHDWGSVAIFFHQLLSGVPGYRKMGLSMPALTSCRAAMLAAKRVRAIMAADDPGVSNIITYSPAPQVVSFSTAVLPSERIISAGGSVMPSCEWLMTFACLAK